MAVLYGKKKTLTYCFCENAFSMHGLELLFCVHAEQISLERISSELHKEALMDGEKYNSDYDALQTQTFHQFLLNPGNIVLN